MTNEQKDQSRSGGFIPPTQPFYVTGNYYSATVMDWRTKCPSGVHVGACSGSAFEFAEKVAALMNVADGNQRAQQETAAPSVGDTPPKAFSDLPPRTTPEGEQAITEARLAFEQAIGEHWRCIDDPESSDKERTALYKVREKAWLNVLAAVRAAAPSGAARPQGEPFPNVPVPVAHQRMADRARGVFVEVPLSASERIADPDPEIGEVAAPPQGAESARPPSQEE